MPSPVHVEQSHVVPVGLEAAYDGVATAPLPSVFRRWFGPLPPIKEVRDETGPWGTSVGQTRTLVTADRGTMREELVTVERPDRFGYTLTQITGPMKPLVRLVEGEWRFTTDGAGTRVTWAWTLHPTSALTAPVVGLVGRLWLPYAKRGLAELDGVLAPS